MSIVKSLIVGNQSARGGLIVRFRPGRESEMSVVKEINAREMLDSRGNPAVEVGARREDGSFGRAMVPSGASAGKHEALELRDGDGNRYGGKGVLRAVRNIRDAADRRLVNRTMTELDGTEMKSQPGANSIRRHPRQKNRLSAVSGVKPRSPPRPALNIVNGDAHR